MTGSREFHGASVEEAVGKAASELGVDVADVSYEVLDSGSGGFMGIGARDARVSVAVPESAKTAATAATVEETVPHDDDSAVPEADDEDVRVGDPATPEAGDRDARPSADVDAPDEVLEFIRRFAASAVEGMGIDARVDVYDAGEFIAVDVASDQAGLFIGQKGETIDALQYLVNVAAYRGRPFVKRAVLDSEGYRQRRVEAIQGMAHRTARRAIRESRSIELPPMNPAERRIVHVYLQENVRVTTRSEGSGDSRRVTVSPA